MMGNVEVDRLVRLVGASNLRDLGGYAGAGGRPVKRGCLYRSGAMPRFGPAEWAWMRAQGIRTIVDLRCAAERELAPTRWAGREGARHILADYAAEAIYAAPEVAPTQVGLNQMHHSLYPRFAALLAPALRDMFGALLERQVPLIVHCSAGQDRTGLAAALLLIALGVEREDVHRDYMMSTACRTPDNELDRLALAAFADDNVVARFYTDIIRRRGLEAVKPKPLVDGDGRPLIEIGLEAIEAEWGSLFAYLDESLGVTAAGVKRLRTFYLDS